MKSSNNIILKPGREKSLLRRHPWVFSGAIERIEGSPVSGETVEVLSSKRQWLARASYSPRSQIAARIWTFTPEEKVNSDFFRQRLQQSAGMRDFLFHQAEIGAYRLVNAESDGLPGLVVDCYRDWLVCQFLTAGIEAWKTEITSALRELWPERNIFERSDVDIRKKEGLPLRKGVLHGPEPSQYIEISENGLKFYVDIRSGHKTGFYLDQRENRQLVAGMVSNGDEVLNCFSYTGGFAIAALRAGAQKAVNIDSSASALELTAANCKLNNMDPGQLENIEGDVFKILRTFRDARRRFDLIVLDPPKFADSKSHLNRAIRGYKDINLLAFKLLKPGGRLATFSCSGLLEPGLFQKIVAGAALDAGRDLRIISQLSQAPDHPIALNFPESAYLKGLICI